MPLTKLYSYARVKSLIKVSCKEPLEYRTKVYMSVVITHSLAYVAIDCDLQGLCFLLAVV